jgi:hypothetical protein
LLEETDYRAKLDGFGPGAEDEEELSHGAIICGGR